MTIKHIHLSEIDSTNSYILSLTDDITDKQMLVVDADYQTAGRGCGRNTWESERGCNLCFSLMLRPSWLKPQHQFSLSMVGALALKLTLDAYADGFTLKWPNDVYWHDSKISGTLIQTRLSSSGIQRFVIGVGLNVNQQEFLSDAPNPISLIHIIGKQTEREVLLRSFLEHFQKLLMQLKEDGAEQIKANYMQSLYRRNGVYAYEDAAGRFEAEIKDILPDGCILLCDTQGLQRQYDFKQLRFVI